VDFAGVLAGKTPPRVHGLAGLRIVGASIFPTVTSGNINAPAIMVGEKGAELLLQDEA
jgi:choline dehydrogenase